MKTVSVWEEGDRVRLTIDVVGTVTEDAYGDLCVESAEDVVVGTVSDGGLEIYVDSDVLATVELVAD